LQAKVPLIVQVIAGVGGGQHWYRTCVVDRTQIDNVSASSSFLALAFRFARLRMHHTIFLIQLALLWLKLLWLKLLWLKLLWMLRVQLCNRWSPTHTTTSSPTSSSFASSCSSNCTSSSSPSSSDSSTATLSIKTPESRIRTQFVFQFHELLELIPLPSFFFFLPDIPFSSPPASASPPTSA